MNRTAPEAIGRRSPRSQHPVPILALDVPTLSAALSLVEQVPAADFYKVGLQLFTAVGPQIVERLKSRGARIFLDLKFHDIPNTVAGAVRSAADLGVDLLTIHAGGGLPMMRAATEAAAGAIHSPAIFAVSILTSMDANTLATTWGREDAAPADEAARLARLAAEAGADGVVASVQDLPALRGGAGNRLQILTPGIRLSGDSAGDQSRIATPADAAAAAVDYVVIGRTVTAAADPAAAFERVRRELSGTSSSNPDSSSI